MSATHMRTLAVALHEVEPATLDRCRHIREWLCEHGVDRATLLVIPARDLHPLASRSPDVAAWLLERRRAGDAIAQHGFQHPRVCGRRSVRSAGLRSARTEFLGMDARETRRAVDAGWRVLKLAGIDPDGFVAPGYAYTPALRDALRKRFRWWAELFSVRHVELAPHLLVRSSGPLAWTDEAIDMTNEEPAVHNTILPPPLAPASPSGLRRSLSRALVRMEAQIETLVPNSTLRLDVHPRDFDRPSRIAALERLLLSLCEDRRAITYDEMALDPPPSSKPFRSGAPLNAARGPATGTPRVA